MRNGCLARREGLVSLSRCPPRHALRMADVLHGCVICRAVLTGRMNSVWSLIQRNIASFYDHERRTFVIAMPMLLDPVASGGDAFRHPSGPLTQPVVRTPSRRSFETRPVLQDTKFSKHTARFIERVTSDGQRCRDFPSGILASGVKVWGNC